MKFINYNQKSDEPRNSNGHAQISHLNELQKMSNNAVTYFESHPVTSESFPYNEDLGYGIRSKPNGILPNIDLSFGNYHSIYINSNFNKFKLPQFNKLSLINLIIERISLYSSYEFNLSEYKNLRSVKFSSKYNRNGLPSLTITDDVIDLPFCQNFISGHSTRTYGVFTKPSITYNVYGNKLTLTLMNKLRDELILDFKNLTPKKMSNGYGIDVLKHLNLIINTTLNDSIKLVNLPEITGLNREASYVNFMFSDNALSTQDVDNILLAIDTAFVENYTYTPEPGDDYVYNFKLKLNDGDINSMVDEFEVIDQGLPCPDGSYYLNEFVIEYKNGVIVNITPTEYAVDKYVDEEITYQEFFKYDNEYPHDILFANDFDSSNPIAQYFVTIKINSVKRLSSPTDGVNNVNYLSLVAKGWKVDIN